MAEGTAGEASITGYLVAFNDHLVAGLEQRRAVLAEVEDHLLLSTMRTGTPTSEGCSGSHLVRSSTPAARRP